MAANIHPISLQALDKNFTTLTSLSPSKKPEFLFWGDEIFINFFLP